MNGVIGPLGLPRGLSRGGLGLELTSDESREVLTVLLIMSRWYCRSRVLASEPRPDRDFDVTERGLRGEGGAGLESLEGKFAGWYLGSPARLRLCAGALAFWLLLIEGRGAGILGDNGEEGLQRAASDLGLMSAKLLCAPDGSRLVEVFFVREE